MIEITDFITLAPRKKHFNILIFIDIIEMLMNEAF